MYLTACNSPRKGHRPRELGVQGLRDGHQPLASRVPHGNRTSNAWKTKELREALNVPSTPFPFPFDFE